MSLQFMRTVLAILVKMMTEHKLERYPRQEIKKPMNYFLPFALKYTLS